jgi:prolyl-tRNA synthetase
VSEQDGIRVKKSENFSEWYTQTIIKSGFVDYTAVSGCLAFRPEAYFAWEQIQKAMDEEFKKIGIKNVYFPLLIPEKLLMKEKEHVEGFSPEVAWVTQTGDTKLPERLAIRPTSEAIMYDSFAKWIRSWRDLPFRSNQWNNVLRWEFKHPIPLLRSREFLWNEGHTVFATKEEAEAERDQILGIYKKITEEYMALPGMTGKKSDREKFAGAVYSCSIEHLLPDGKAIQGPDFHHDGQNFSKAFEIKFLDKNKQTNYVWQNTWGFSTREMGVMIAVHSDDRGLVLPPRLALLQVVIVPIFEKKNREKILTVAKKIQKSLSDKVRVNLDDRDDVSPGWKFNEWELKGVPVRIEIGPRDIVKSQVVLARRDTGEKKIVKISKLATTVVAMLEEIQKNIYKKAEDFLKKNIRKAKNYSEFKNIIEKSRGFVQVCWCGDSICEDKIKDETGAKITNIPFKQEKVFSKCIYCGKEAKYVVNFAKSY